MFETSRDILNISISTAVVVLVVFLCISLYYLIANLKRINKISRQIEEGVDKVDNLIDLIRNKLRQSNSYLMLFGNLVEKGLDFLNNRKQEKKENDENNNKKNNKKSK
jgi:predicted PurR-regulated permease PerM